ncbi:MAG: prepilin-type N-terminal cleavage/methylation domain-containing protein [Candidatus Palauibacterales bacterium]|jgi:type II secretory pathway pseudopilin PulG|nr:prepilin-type N-terminal cleavage/methylation domain-containing protein [Candidatus Palauibacterales bacterium]MDP2484014.1 prepilin-type N-terminal cleavage/methylation domain-containing protein [Candidatus Palauibacterales bacterium]
MKRIKSEAGFTIVEALITLVISGLLASAMLSLLLGQSRFYEHTDDQIWAEQSNRATFDIVSSELRMASATDLLAAESDSVAVRFDIMRAIVCDTTATDEATLMVYDTVAAWGLDGGFLGTAYSDPYEEDFEYADAFLPSTVSTGSGPKATCVANGSPSSNPDNSYAQLSGWGGNFTSGVPDPGAMVRFYSRLSYHFAPSSFFSSRTALWRGSQELVGPYENDAAFSYLMDDGSVQSSVSSANFDQVVAIRVTATAIGDGANRYDVERDLQFDIPFRN